MSVFPIKVTHNQNPTDTMQKSLLAILRNPTVQKFLKILILVTVCLYLYSIVEWREVINLFKNISAGYFLLTLFVCLFDQVFMALKWQILLRIFKIRVSLTIPILAYLGGRAINIVIPSGVGIDAYKTYYLKKHGIVLLKDLIRSPEFENLNKRRWQFKCFNSKFGK